MCFSAEASLTASAVLGATGAIALSKSKFHNQFMLAAIPLLFSIQQLLEGFLWEAIHHNNIPDQKLYTILFLLFAQIIWPTWFPLSILQIETNPQRKKILYYVLIAGITTSVLLGLRMVFSDITLEQDHQHIRYEIKSPQWSNVITSVLYFIAVIFPGFISTVKHLKIVAVILLMSLLVSIIFFQDYLISVWCYFAAIISIILIFAIKRNRTATVN